MDNEIEQLAKKLYEGEVQFPNWEREQEHLREAYRARVREGIVQADELMKQIAEAPELVIPSTETPPGVREELNVETGGRFPPTELPIEDESKPGLPESLREELDGLREVATRGRGRRRRGQQE